MRHEDIIAKVNILDLIGKLQIEGKISGKEFIARCPFPEHNDTIPSFSICLSGDRSGMWQCFSCGAKGNTIHLVQRVLGLEKEQAEKKIAEWFGFADTLNFPTTDEISKLLADKPKPDVEEDMIKIPLPKTEISKDTIIQYLIKRRKYTEIKAWDIINFFNLSWISSGYYAGRMIIPLYDSLGSLVTFEARNMLENDGKKALYPKGSPMGQLLFNNHNIIGNMVWITEGVWDAIRLWSFGEPAIATFGAHLSNSQAQLIIDKYSDVFLLYDGDEAGRVAKDHAIEVLKPYVNVFGVDLCYGDPAELSKEDFRELLRQVNIKR